MGIFENTSSVETPSDFMIEMMMDKKDGEEFTREYLKTRFLSSVGRSLYYARRQAGLTQAEIAERMNTTQSAIARFEADKNGSMSFRRYADFAIACGMMPRSLVLHSILESIASLRNEMIVSFALKPSQGLPGTRRSEIIRAVLSAQSQGIASTIGHTPLPIQHFQAAIEANQTAASQFQQRSFSANAPTTSASSLVTIASQSTVDNTKVKFDYA